MLGKLPGPFKGPSRHYEEGLGLMSGKLKSCLDLAALRGLLERESGFLLKEFGLPVEFL